MKTLYFSNKRNRQKGFTLIEIIVVIAIIGILSAIIFPRVSKYLDETKAIAVQADARVIVTAAHLYYLDVGEFPETDVTGNPYEAELWKNDSYRLFMEGETDSGELIPGWNGPYLVEWPRQTHFGGVYAYRRIEDEDNVTWINFESQGGSEPEKPYDMIYLRFEEDYAHQDRVYDLLDKYINYDIYKFTNGEPHIAIVVRKP